jgi:hypothetical protein
MIDFNSTLDPHGRFVSMHKATLRHWAKETPTVILWRVAVALYDFELLLNYY